MKKRYSLLEIRQAIGLVWDESDSPALAIKEWQVAEVLDRFKHYLFQRDFKPPKNGKGK